jgi:hypothetical protein
MGLSSRKSILAHLSPINVSFARCGAGTFGTVVGRGSRGCLPTFGTFAIGQWDDPAIAISCSSAWP